MSRNHSCVLSWNRESLEWCSERLCRIVRNTPSLSFLIRQKLRLQKFGSCSACDSSAGEISDAERYTLNLRHIALPMANRSDHIQFLLLKLLFCSLTLLVVALFFTITKKSFPRALFATITLYGRHYIYQNLKKQRVKRNVSLIHQWQSQTS